MITDNGKDYIEKRIERIPFSGCWIWTMGRMRAGYGSIRINRKHRSAHRFSYETFVGKIPDGLFVCHQCDVRDCVNPHHLFLGTNAENVADCMKKGRQKRGTGRSLSADDVLEIEKLLSSGVRQKVIAARFHVRPCSISNIYTGRTWGPTVRENDRSRIARIDTAKAYVEANA